MKLHKSPPLPDNEGTLPSDLVCLGHGGRGKADFIVKETGGAS